MKRLIALTTIALLSACSTLTDRTVTVTEAQLQQKLENKLIAPITVLKFFNVNLSKPVIKLDGASERMTATLDASVTNPLGRPMNGKASISGKLRFDPASQSVLLNEAKIESLNIDGLGARSNEMVTVLSQQLGGDLLKDLPLYTLKPDDLKVAGISLTAKNMRITPKGLEVTLAPK